MNQSVGQIINRSLGWRCSVDSLGSNRFVGGPRRRRDRGAVVWRTIGTLGLVLPLSALMVWALFDPLGAGMDEVRQAKEHEPLAVSVSVSGPLGSSQTAGDQAEPALDFGREVLPILSNHCFQCHGPDDANRAAGLQLDQREAAIQSGVLIPGDADVSPMIARINHANERLVMPPPGANRDLSDEKKRILAQWIDDGAVYGQHWSFVAPARPELPENTHDTWNVHPIDRLLLPALREVGLEPMPESALTRLCRRVHLDLTGLPPTPAQVEAFLSDERPDRYEHLVDGLLASPRFGEAWASWWLDQARYADSKGFATDRLRTIWPYRD